MEHYSDFYFEEAPRPTLCGAIDENNLVGAPSAVDCPHCESALNLRQLILRACDQRVIPPLWTLKASASPEKFTLAQIKRACELVGSLI